MYCAQLTDNMYSKENKILNFPLQIKTFCTKINITTQNT